MPAKRPPLIPVLAVAAAALLALAHTGEVRARAEAALDRGMPAREAALARGFILGEDERIDAATAESFRRSGLSHLLAVSGQNVALLVLLAMPVLAALGLGLRARLLWAIGLIAVYVPLAGAGPSIQRAGVMGALSVWATLAGRRPARFYVLALAALVTLAFDPGVAADVGWQLSFAAVLGILLLARPLRQRIEALTGTARAARGLAEGAAMTVAATLATAPLIAFHFGAVSTTTVVANLLALPAVAPAMWLGMLTAAAGQVPGAPVAALNALNAPLLAYIAQVAAWCGSPDWAYVEVHIGGWALPGSYAAIALLATLAVRLGRRWADGVMLPLGLLLAPAGGGEPPRAGLRVSVLDVGQGDAILLQPAGAPAVLVDAGPAGAGLAAKLRAAGVERLGAAVVSHDQSDHAGGVRELLSSLPVGRLIHARLGHELRAAASAAGVPLRRLARGGSLRSGRLRLQVLWPPSELLEGPLGSEDPNRLALVLLARWGRFEMLLPADAEAEVTPLDPGPVDVLKVAHHGSEDAGLGELLDRTRPRLAVISVGAGNPFGHPAPTTLATLARRRVPALRTDRDGDLVLEVRRDGLRLDE